MSEQSAEFIYFWLGFVSFEMVVSFFYYFTKNGRPVSRWNNRFQGTTRVTLIIVIIVSLYWIGESFLHKPLVDTVASLGDTTFPLTIFGVALFAFYTSFVMIHSKITHRMVLGSLTITLLSAGIAVLMFLNGNKIL